MKLLYAQKEKEDEVLHKDQDRLRQEAIQDEEERRDQEIRQDNRFEQQREAAAKSTTKKLIENFRSTGEVEQLVEILSNMNGKHKYSILWNVTPLKKLNVSDFIPKLSETLPR